MATWTIVNMERNTSDGGVIIAHWRVTETETVGEGDDAITYSASSYGTCGFTPDPTDPGFTPYDDLVEAEVLSWCWVSGNVDQAEIEAALADNIAEQKTPVTTDGVPW